MNRRRAVISVTILLTYALQHWAEPSGQSGRSGSFHIWVVDLPIGIILLLAETINRMCVLFAQSKKTATPFLVKGTYPNCQRVESAFFITELGSCISEHSMMGDVASFVWELLKEGKEVAEKLVEAAIKAAENN